MAITQRSEKQNHSNRSNLSRKLLFDVTALDLSPSYLYTSIEPLNSVHTIYYTLIYIIPIIIISYNIITEALTDSVTSSNFSNEMGDLDSIGFFIVHANSTIFNYQKSMSPSFHRVRMQPGNRLQQTPICINHG